MGRLPLEALAGQGNGVMPGVRVWQSIETTPEAMRVLEKGKKGPYRRDALKAYLTKPVTQEQLQPIAAVKDTASASRLLHRAIVKIWPLLPEDIHRDFQTPEQALHGQTGTVDNLRSLRASTGNARRAIAIEEGTYTGKPIGKGRRGKDKQPRRKRQTSTVN